MMPPISSAIGKGSSRVVTTVYSGLAVTPRCLQEQSLTNPMSRKPWKAWKPGSNWICLTIVCDSTLLLLYYEYTDMQLSAFDPIALVQRVLNAGESTIQGAEFDLLYLPESVEGLSLSLGLAYTDATFDRFVGQCYAGQTAAGGCNVSVPGNPAAQQDLAGRELLYAPDLMVTAGLTHSTQLSGDWGLRSALSLSYSDAYRYAATYGPTEAQDSYTKVNASLSLEYQDNWEFSLIGNNLTDEYSVGGGGNAAFMPPFHTGAVVSRGRQITLQAQMEPLRR